MKGVFTIANYLYYGIFTLSKETGRYYVDFKDIESGETSGENMEEALKHAYECLAVNLLTIEDDNEPVPLVSSPQELREKYEVGLDDLIIPIQVDTKILRLKEKLSVVRRNVTIPAYLDELGRRNNINFSQFLQHTLREYLDVK